MSLKPMNCPSHHSITRRRSTRIASCRCATSPSTCCTATSSPARSPASRACGSSRRTTATSTCARTRSPSEVRVPDGLHPRLLRPSGSRRRSSSPRARAADRQRRAVGPRRGGAAGALESTGLPYELKEGDGAFYGPKIDFDVTDSIGRAWQLGTIQLDYNAPERFDLELHGRGQRAAPAGGDPPRGERLVRALHRHPDRALRRRLPGLAGPGAGARDPISDELSSPAS
jgi:threonyl-tRNA synthetase